MPCQPDFKQTNLRVTRVICHRSIAPNLDSSLEYTNWKASNGKIPTKIIVGNKTCRR